MNARTEQQLADIGKLFKLLHNAEEVANRERVAAALWDLTIERADGMWQLYRAEHYLIGLGLVEVTDDGYKARGE